MSLTPNSAVRAIDRVVDALRAGGHDHRVRGQHVQASCPLHDDTHPSLSIDQRGDRVVLHCHSGRNCTEREVAEVLGLRYDELWDVPANDCEKCGKLTLPDESGRYLHPYCAGKKAGGTSPRRQLVRKPRKGPLPRRLTAAAKPEIVKRPKRVSTHEHITLDGEVVAESVRREGVHRLGDEEVPFKLISQRYADGHGGWVYSKPEGIEVPLWRLPEVREAVAAGEFVYLTEGHKDAEAVLEAGVAATTAITTSEFGEVQAEQLRGADVVVVCDRDRAGYHRGVEVARLLDGVASSVRLVLPAPTHAKADAYDHLVTGLFGLEEFVEVSVARLQALHDMAVAADHLEQIDVAVTEARAQLQRRTETLSSENAEPSVRGAAEAERAAGRWAQQAGEEVLKARTVLLELSSQSEGPTVTEVDALQARLAAAVEVALEAHQLAGVEPESSLFPELTDDDSETGEDDTAGITTSEPADQVSNVVTLPSTGNWRPEQPLPSVGRTEWAYSTREGRRGVYLFTKLSQHDPGRWQLMAPLPFVACRVPRRDGAGRRLATDYRISMEAGSRAHTVDHLGLRTGSWANALGVPLSDDPKVVAAAGTAIRMAGAAADEVEAVPTVDVETDRIVLPHDKPRGYLDCAPVDPEVALDHWRELVGLLTSKQALVLAASAGAPFIRSSGAKAHVISLSGGARQGKSTTNLAAAAVWGRPWESNVHKSWNASPQAVPRLLGELRILPHFRDEAGLAKFDSTQWGQFIYSVTEGNSRDTPDRMGGQQTTRPWWGVLFSTGNGEMTRGLGSGPFQGVPRRVIELAGPFTPDRETARRIHPEGEGDGGTGLVSNAYGHLGAQILGHVTTTQARELREQARAYLECPEGAEDIAEYLYSHLAGAMMVDQVLDTNLLEAATEGAQNYLDQWAPAPLEADRIADIVEDSIHSEPSRWPTREQYAAHLRPFPLDGGSDQARLPQAGVAREVLGVRPDDGTVWVLRQGWAELIGSTDINARVGCQQLLDRGDLHVSDAGRLRGDFTMAQRLTPGAGTSNRARVYVLRRRDQDAEVPPTPQQPDPGPAEDPDLDLFDPGVTGSDPGVTGSDPGVTGGVTGTQSALTRSVTGVTGSRATPSCDARDATPTVLVHDEGSVPLDTDHPGGPWTDVAGVEHRRDWAKTSGPCIECSRPCVVIVDGHRIHLPCWERRYAASEVAATPSPEAPTASSAVLPPAVQQPATAAPARTSRPSASARWSGPAAVLTADLVHLPGGHTQPWTTGHLGDLAMLTDERTGLRIGWGGDKERLPYPGQVWLTDGALQRLGLPTHIDWPDDDHDHRDQTVTTLMAPLTKLPVVARALEAGWELQGDHLRPWSRISHPDHLRRGAHLVVPSWDYITPPALFEGDIPPAELADRLADFAQAVTVPYLITPPVTGLQLVERCRPSRRDAEDQRGVASGRRAVIGWQAAELPPFLRAREDARFSAVELDFAWYRLWEDTPRSQWGPLTEAERELPYVHGYDRGASYLGQWGSIELGVEGLEHRTGDEAVWDGKEKPGYYLVQNWEWPTWALPDPATAARARVEDGRRWVTTHTLRQLLSLGIEPVVHESYTWGVTSRYLEQPHKLLTSARQHPTAAVRETVKSLYAATTGKFGQRDAAPHYHFARPDWQHHIIASARTGILHTLRTNLDLTGAAPIAVDHDAIFYASSEPDPIKAWPGKPEKLGTSPGSWKPIGSGNLSTWGPRHLVDVTPSTGGKGFRVFRYADAVADLTREG